MAKWARSFVLLTALLTPGRARAEPPSDDASQIAAEQRAAKSEQLAAQGFEAYKAGEYHTALQFYDQALEAHPAAALYFNAARIYDTKLSAPERAIEYYRKTLEARDVTDALAEKSNARIRVLTALLAQSKPPEEQAEPPEREPSSAEQEPQPTEHQPQADESDGRDGRAAPKGDTQKTVGYAVGITGLVAAGAGLGLGGFALLERNKARETCEGNQCTTQDGVDSMNTAHGLASASTITMVAGGALAVVGFGMVLFAPQRKPADRDSGATVHQQSRRATGPVGLQFAVSPTSGGARLQLAGAFF